VADQKPNNRERVKEIVAGIEQNIQELFQSERYFDYLRTMSRFHSYSVNNTILIHMQRPHAANPVAGFQKWKQFGRHVKKGEKGLTIIAPTPLKKKIEEMRLDPETKAPVLDQDGNLIFDEKTVEIPLFKPVKVFSADQTDGKPLPSLTADLTGNVQQYEAFMEALRRTSPMPIVFGLLAPDTDGLCSFTRQTITIREGMSEVQTVCAAVHEIGHAVLHDREKDRLTSAAGNTEPPKAKDKNTMEVEAESVSFAVCQYYGIDTSANSMGYIAGWSKDRSLPELKASLETITKTVSGLISSIDKHFAEICKEQGIDLTTQQPEQDTPAAAPDTPEKFAADLYDFMDQLHQAGVLEHPFTQDHREQSAADLVAEMQAGHFDGVRDPLTYIAAHTDLPTVRTLTDRMNLLSAELEDWKSASTQYVTDFFSHLNELHEAGLISAPYHTNERDKFEKEFLTYMQDGKFDSFRRVLKDVEGSADTPAVTVLRDRLEKLSDRWDAALVCKVEPMYDFGTGNDRSVVQTYTNLDGQPFPGDIVFVGTQRECQNVMIGLEAGTFTLRQVRQPDFEPPEPEYVYKMDANPRATGADDQHFVQAYVKTAKQTLIPESVLFVGRADMCASLVERLNSGSLQRDDLITVSEARESCYTTKDGTELDAFVGLDKKVYMGRRDHYDNHGHYLNDDKSLIHISDTYRVFDLISGRETPYTYDQLFSTSLFSQEEALSFIRLQLNGPQTEKDAEILSSPDTILDEYPLPDTLFQVDELEKNYGYMEGDLLPIGRNRAISMLHQDFTVYAIVDGGSAEMTFDWTDLEERPLDTMYAVSKEEWEASPDFQQAVADRMQHQEDREQAFLNHGGDCFAIYQIKDGAEQRDLRFMDMDWLMSKGLTIDRDNYDLVYTGELAPGQGSSALERLWERFNIDHPADYHRPSMSVSDILAVKQDGVVSFHYCDSVGFAKVPDFIRPENYLKNAEVAVEDDLSMIDGIINNGSKATAAELEQQARSGQPISLMELAEATHRERGEKKSVLAKLNAPPPKQGRKKTAPKKSAEKER